MPEPPDLIRWRDWSRDSLLEAEQRDVPVFLMIHQFWSAESRLMRQRCTAEADIAQTLEQDFVPILVDASLHPDVDRRYRQGGWPAIAFLTPEALPITSMGYAEPDVLANALAGVADLYRRDREGLLSRVSSLEQAREDVAQLRTDPSRQPNPWMTLQVVDILKAAADPDFGGFGGAPRFPHFEALELMLAVYRRSQQPDLLKIATDALDGMMQGGLYDWDGGGFFRCSAEQDWSEPRQEKLLIDQANHIFIYLMAHRLTGTVDYKEAAVGCLEYAMGRLRNAAEGWFAASEIAGDSFLENGIEYEVPEGASRVDRTLILPGNCRMSRSLMFAGASLSQQDLRRTGVRLVDLLLEKLAPAGQWAHHYHDGEAPARPGLLSDQAELGLALLDAYQHTGNSSYLSKADYLASRIADDLYDARQPGFYDAHDPMDLHRLGLRDKAYDDNMNLSRFASRLALITGSGAARAMAERALGGFSGVWEKLGAPAASFGLGLLDLFSEPIMITISGDSPEADALQQAAAEALEQAVMIRRESSDSAAASVEIGGTSRGKATTPADLLALVQQSLRDLPASASA